MIKMTFFHQSISKTRTSFRGVRTFRHLLNPKTRRYSPNLLFNNKYISANKTYFYTSRLHFSSRSNRYERFYFLLYYFILKIYRLTVTVTHRLRFSYEIKIKFLTLKLLTSIYGFYNCA